MISQKCIIFFIKDDHDYAREMNTFWIHHVLERNSEILIQLLFKGSLEKRDRPNFFVVVSVFWVFFFGIYKVYIFLLKIKKCCIIVYTDISIATIQTTSILFISLDYHIWKSQHFCTKYNVLYPYVYIVSLETSDQTSN